jgi:predicted ribosome quality control (RQC) complex YloA/Tae2 family protein
MDNLYLSALIREAEPALSGRVVSSVQIRRHEVHFDFLPPGPRRLVAILEADRPSIFLSESRSSARPAAASSSPFAVQLREYLAGATLRLVAKEPWDRIVRLEFYSEHREPEHPDSERVLTLVVELTGRTSNAHLVGDGGQLLSSMRGNPPKAAGGMTGNNPTVDETEWLRAKLETASPEIFAELEGKKSLLGPRLQTELRARAATAGPVEALRSLLIDLQRDPPVPLIYSAVPLEEIGNRLIDPRSDLVLSHVELRGLSAFERNQFPTLSSAVEAYAGAVARAQRFKGAFASVKKALANQAAKRRATLDALESDRERHQDPGKLKRSGELLLANLATARLVGQLATVVDYYDENQREVEIELPAGASLPEAAASYFKRYQKANRAIAAINSRSAVLKQELDALVAQLDRLQSDPTSATMEKVRAACSELGVRLPRIEDPDEGVAPKKRKEAAPVVGRRFRSSDGYEIVVGRNDRENDLLTFRIARSSDVWMHAADYPGSHVLIRNPGKGDVPPRTLTEAAELAAFNSQAKGAGKVAVHYTLKKFVTKPPKAKPGLARLSSFKTIMVEARVGIPRLSDALLRP